LMKGGLAAAAVLLLASTGRAAIITLRGSRGQHPHHGHGHDHSHDHHGHGHDHPHTADLTHA
ncbi:MAG: hypothetical protein QOJ31_142, partial [Gaiellales bacterium]|nr:hypothetical protein [Gaiellales bacterium]